VTLRVAEDVPSLRRGAIVAVVRRCIANAHRETFRVIHFNALSNHVHLIVEASDEQALSRGMQGLEVRLARHINRVLERSGKLFADRYHARALTSPREVRNAIRYVLCNARHHAAERGERLAKYWIDPCSSAAWFDGWREAIRADEHWKQRLIHLPMPTARPTVWLLTTGWRRGGLLAFDEVPG
jgi:REP element-mobilizing transposase RayT